MSKIKAQFCFETYEIFMVWRIISYLYFSVNHVEMSSLIYLSPNTDVAPTKQSSLFIGSICQV